MQYADKILYHAYLVTVNDSMDVYEDGAVAIRDGVILAAGRSETLLEHYQAEELWDASGAILMPGWVDGHAHLATTLFGGLSDAHPHASRRQKTWLAEREFLTPENVTVASRLAMSELLAGGTTCVLDMFWFPEAAAQAALDTGMRLVTGPFFMDIDDTPDASDFVHRVAFAREFDRQYPRTGTVHLMLMPFNLCGVSHEELRSLAELAEELDVHLQIQVAESAAEVQYLQTRCGLTPVRLLHSLGVLDERTLLAHCAFLDEREVELIGQQGCAVALNPLNTMKQAAGLTLIERMQKAQVKTCLGTDTAACCNDLDMWCSLRMAALMYKECSQHSGFSTAREIIRLGTIDGARAAGLQEKVGSLEAGKKADLMALRAPANGIHVRDEIYAHLVYNAGREDIEAVMVNGGWVMKNGRLLKVDRQQVAEEAAALEFHIQRRMLDVL